MARKTYICTISAEDVGSRKFGGSVLRDKYGIEIALGILDTVGRILPIDVGKRVYFVRDDADAHDVYQIESNEQLARRLACRHKEE